MKSRWFAPVVLSIALPLPASARDCDEDGIEDALAIANGAAPDCNGNGVPDGCDVAHPGVGFSAASGIPLLDMNGRPLLAAADVDLDGRLDAIVITGHPDYVYATVQVFRNRGSGELEPVGAYSAGPGAAAAMEAADIDGDRDPDLLLESYRAPGLQILRNRGDGSLDRPEPVPGWPIPIGEDPRSGDFAVADLDGDRDLDLACAFAASGLRISLNAGGGTFGPPESISAGLEPTLGVRAADLDGDGHVDLAVSDRLGLLILRNAGGGAAFEPGVRAAGLTPRSLCLSDLDGDADLDIAATSYHDRGSVAVILNTGRGPFAGPAFYPTEEPPQLVIAADFDADGRDDLATVNEPVHCGTTLGSLSVLLNRGDGTFFPSLTLDARYRPHGIAAGDVDGDGRADLLTVTNPPGAPSTVIACYRNEPRVRSLDCNRNGVPDECELQGADLNANGVPDGCDIASGSSRDCDGNGVPDESDGDCNGNRVADSCDVASGESADADRDGIPDECRRPLDPCRAAGGPGGGPAPDDLDCDGNGIADACDLAPPFRLLAEERLPLPSPPSWVAAADLDGDADLDLAAARGGACCPFRAGGVSILLNAGRAAFFRAGDYACGADPAFVAAADLDGDGDLDLAIANRRLACQSEGEYAGSITVLGNCGNGTFERVAAFARGVNVFRLAPADLDGDGDLDLAAVHRWSSRTQREEGIAVFLNGGRGTFHRAQPDPFSGPVENALALGDLDGDGDVDLAAGSWGPMHTPEIRLLLNAGGAVFQDAGGLVPRAGADHLEAADLDGDGRADLAAASHDAGEPASIFWNDGATFTLREAALAGLECSHHLLLDVDGDGLRDLVRAGDRGSGLFPNGHVSVVRNLGRRELAAEPAFLAAGESPVSVAGGDLDGDGRTDLVAAGAYLSSIALVRDAARNLDRPPILTAAVSAAPTSLAAADFDGDGDQDVAVARSFGVSILANDGLGRFASGGQVPVGSDPVAMAAADLDGDGDVDLATANSLDSRPAGLPDNASIIINAGGGAFRTARNYAVEPGASGLAAADLDGDADVDLAVASALSPVLTLLWNEGGAAFRSTRGPPLGAFPHSVLAADLDGDADVDLAVASVCSPGLTLLWNDGGAAFRSARGPLPEAFPDAVLAADVEGDGDVDLLVRGTARNGIEATLVVLRNAGGGDFVPAWSAPIWGSSRRFIAADLDRDGDQDLVFRQFELLKLLRNVGGEAFEAGADFIIDHGEDSIVPAADDRPGGDIGPPDTASGVSAMLAADLDGDGDPDIVAAREDLDLVSAVLNRTRRASPDRDGDGAPDACTPPAAPFRRGDASGDGRLDLTDAARILGFLFHDAGDLGCRKAADANDDGRLNAADAVRVLSYLFLDAGPLPAPSPACGAEATPDALSCVSYPACR